MVTSHQKTFAVLDLGTSRTSCFIARITSDRSIEIIGIGSAVSNGIRAGIVTDIRAAEDTVTSAVQAAESMAGLTLEEIAVSISGSKVKSHRLTLEERIKGREITSRDIDQIIQTAYQQFDPEMHEVIHCLPVSYNLDGETGIKDPVGMYGMQLTVDMHIVTTTSTSLMNIANCLAHCHLNISECVLAPYAAGISCLTQDERELGTTLIDMGGGHTAIAVFKAGQLVHTETIALGGMHITNDLAWGISTTTEHAERIKIQHGSAVEGKGDKYENIDVPLIGAKSDETQLVDKTRVGAILRPRVQEIFEQIKKRLEETHIDQMSGGRIVLTGGTSQLNGMQDFASHYLDKPVRIANPKFIRGMAESNKACDYAVAVGMVQCIADKYSKMLYRQDQEGKASKYVGKVTNWFKNNF